MNEWEIDEENEWILELLFTNCERYSMYLEVILEIRIIPSKEGRQAVMNKCVAIS